MLGENSVDSHRQHYSGGIHQQTRGNEIRPLVCPVVANPVLVHQESGNTKSQTYSGSPECGGRQIVQTGPNNSDGVVPPPRDFQGNLPKMASATTGSVCHQVQQQTGSICEPSARSTGVGSGCPKPELGGVGSLCISTDGPPRQSGGKAPKPTLQADNSDRPRVAQHALVLGSGGHVCPNALEPAAQTRFVDSTIQQNPARKSGESKSPRVATRANAIKERGFSEAVAARIEAPQRSSTRDQYKGKWAVFEKWCHENKVDLGSASIKSIADFLLYLFEVKGLQPSTIDGYRSAIADKLGNSPFSISKDEDLTRLLDSFHRDRPKGRRGVPSWNLSLVLHQLTKAPFEPMQDASLKHLTFKTVFLLALTSGKRRSEIHAWLNKYARYKDNYSTVALSPSASFISKNQLAREGPGSVSTVVIPALTPTLDKSLTQDRTLCPVLSLIHISSPRDA